MLAIAGCTGAAHEAGGMEEPASSLAAIKSEYVRTPFEAPFARVHRVDLPAEAAIGLHEGSDRVVYCITAYTLRYDTSGTGETHV